MTRSSTVCPVRLRLRLLGAALVGWGLVISTPGLAGDPPAESARVIYRPVAADFQPEYQRDAANRRVQTWEQYWGWVTSYYQGNFLSNGWIKETELSLARVTDPALRQEFLQEMNAAGRLVSREWAKDGGVRKINTNDLIAWGNRLNTVRRDAKDNGAMLLATARQIHADAQRQIAGRPANP